MQRSARSAWPRLPEGRDVASDARGRSGGRPDSRLVLVPGQGQVDHQGTTFDLAATDVPFRLYGRAPGAVQCCKCGDVIAESTNAVLVAGLFCRGWTHRGCIPPEPDREPVTR